MLTTSVRSTFDLWPESACVFPPPLPVVRASPAWGPHPYSLFSVHSQRDPLRTQVRSCFLPTQSPPRTPTLVRVKANVLPVAPRALCDAPRALCDAPSFSKPSTSLMTSSPPTSPLADSLPSPRPHCCSSKKPWLFLPQGLSLSEGTCCSLCPDSSTTYSPDSLPHPLQVSVQMSPLKAAFSEPPRPLLYFSFMGQGDGAGERHS